MRILIDLDGIVVDLLSVWLQLYNREWNDHLTKHDITAYDFSDLVKPECGRAIFKDYLSRPGLFAALPPIPGAVDALKELQERGHEIVIASYPPSPEAAKDKLIWIEKYLPFISKHYWTDMGQSCSTVMLGHEKWMLKADAIIDDDPYNVVTYGRAWPSAKLIMMDYPYNRQVPSVDPAGPVILPRESRNDIYVALDYRDTANAWKSILKMLP